MNFWRHKKIIFGVLLAVIIFGVQFVNIVSAANPPAAETIASAGISGYLILALASKILIFAAALVDFVVKLGNDVLNLPAGTAGWGTVLHITNLGFVLGIIVIAF